jgi:hypothetical protein
LVTPKTRGWPLGDLASPTTTTTTHERASVSKNPGWVNSVQ